VSATLIICKGAREVQREELERYPAPAPSRNWYPISHLDCADTVQAALEEAGYSLSGRRYSLDKTNHRFIGVFDLYAPLTDDRQVNLAVAAVNSTNQVWPMGFLAGNRVMCCWNLCMGSDLMRKYTRKHTRNGRQDFVGNVSRIVTGLGQYREVEAARIGKLQSSELSDVQAEALILRMYDFGIVKRELPRVIREWRSPSFPQFEPRTAWSLLNAATTALGDRAKSNPNEHARSTIRLQSLISGFVGFDSPTLAFDAPKGPVIASLTTSV
jgi:hypothetical protein